MQDYARQTPHCHPDTTDQQDRRPQNAPCLRGRENYDHHCRVLRNENQQFLVLIDAIPDGEAEVSCWPQSLNTLHALGKSGSHLSLKGEDNLVSDAALSDRSAVECGFENRNILQARPHQVDKIASRQSALSLRRREIYHHQDGHVKTKSSSTAANSTRTGGGPRRSRREKCVNSLSCRLYCACKSCKFHALLSFHLKA